MVNREFERIIGKQNKTPLEDFSGLSPEQMFYLMRFKDFESLTPILRFNKNIAEKKLLQTPIMNFESKFIEILRENGGKIKLTDNRNLKLKDVRNLFLSSKFLSEHRYYDLFKSGRWKINTEEAIPNLYRMRNLITLNRDFFTERKTLLNFKEKQFAKRSAYERFLSYLGIAMIRVNWSYFYWSEFNYYIIPQGFLFSLYLLHKFGDTYRDRDFYSDKFLQAFPLKVHWFNFDIPYYQEYLDEKEIDELSKKDTEKERKISYHNRTFNIMKYFGFTDEKIEGEEYLKQKTFYKKSDFFKEFVKFDLKGDFEW